MATSRKEESFTRFVVSFVFFFIITFVIAFFAVAMEEPVKQTKIEYEYHGETRYANTRPVSDLDEDYVIIPAIVAFIVATGGATLVASSPPKSKQTRTYEKPNTRQAPRKRSVKPVQPVKPTKRKRSTDWYDHELEGDHDLEGGWCVECEEDEDDLD